jgi:DNA-binding NarL/FixJ family response regulator
MKERALTPRQRKVLELLRRGLRPKEIALALDLSVGHVRNCVVEILKRYEVDSIHALQAMWIRELSNPGPP